MEQISEYFPRELLERYGSTVEEAGSEAMKAIDGVIGRLEALTAEQLARPVAPGKWTPIEVVDHLYRVTLLYLEGLEGMAEGRQPTRHERGFVGEDGALVAAIPGAEPLPDRGLIDVTTDLRAGTARLIEAAGAAVAAGSGASVAHVNPYFGELTALGAVQMAALHARHHRKRHLDHLVKREAPTPPT